MLGAGGFGITYLAEESALARLVTIKEYFPADFAARTSDVAAAPRSTECATDYKWGLDRFIEEAQTLARFVHPNIVRVYRYFRANNTGYMVLHWEEGGSLKSWLKNLKRAPRQAELDGILVPLLDALETVHKGDFLHRDIAPDNIIIRKDGSPVLIDFGSARGEIASHSKTVSALVKPGYSPYEQYATTSSKQGPWTDIYALGATLYHAVAGKRPPDAPSRMVTDDYISAREAALRSVPPTFLAAVDKALRLETTERPQSIADWRGSLLMPDGKRDKKGLGLPIGRKSRTAEVRPEKPADPDKTKPVTADAKSLIPAPPDAPQKQGQLLDFIEALKKHRPPVLSARKKGGGELKKRLAQIEPVQPIETRAPAEPQFGLGYGPPPDAMPHGKAGAASPIPAAKGAQAARPGRTPGPAPPRRVRAWRLSTRQWGSLAFKLLIGVGIAALAVAYQEKVPQYQGRGAAVVSSQTGRSGADAQAHGARRRHYRRGHRRSGPLDRVDRRRRHAAHLEQRIGRPAAHGSTLDEGAGDRALGERSPGLDRPQGGAIALWDMDRTEKLAVLQHRGPVSAVAFTADPNRFFAANQDGAVALFDVRSPTTPAPLSEETETGAQLVALARSSGMLVTGGQDRSIRLWRADTHGLPRSWKTNAEGVTALDIARRTQRRRGRRGRDGAAVGDGFHTCPAHAEARWPHHGGGLSPNGSMLATAGEDGIVKLWNLRSGRSARRPCCAAIAGPCAP